MIPFVITIVFFLLVSLVLNLYMIGVFHKSPLSALRLTVYLLLLFLALTLGIGIVFNRDNPASVE
jgi:hypothetical protein